MTSTKQAITIPLRKSYDIPKVLQVSKKIQWEKLAITTNDEVRFIPFEDIMYCKSTSNYTTIFIRGEKSYLCSKTLKDIESKLPEDLFFRIHHSYLVNLQYITALNKQQSELELANKLLLPVSRTQKTALYKLLDA